MALKKEEFEALIEREGVMDFIWVRSWKDIPNTNIGIFEIENDRWGCVFEIFPSVYAGYRAEQKLSNFYNNTDLPAKSSVQFISFASRNIKSFMDLYSQIHSYESNIENKEALKYLKEVSIEWLKKHANENVFSSGNDLRLRNFVNLVCVTIPKEKKNGVEYSESEIISFFSKVEQSLNEFRPTKFTRRQYVILMRELLIPDNPLWFPPDDPYNEINFQVVNNDSVITLEEDYMGIGTAMSEKEYKEKFSSEIMDKAVEEAEEDSFLAKLFRKKKEEAHTKVYTQWKAKTFTTKMFPTTISMQDITSKFYDYFGNKLSPIIPCPFYLSLIVYFEDKEKIKKEVEASAKWDMWQTESLGESVKRMFPIISERAAEAEAINYMVHHGVNPMRASWSCTIMDNSERKLIGYADRIKEEFYNSDWILQEETLIPHWIFLYHLPLNFEPYVLGDLAKRMNTLFSSNCATITPLVTGDKGYGDPVLMFVDRGGQVAGADIFASKVNFNFIVVGTSGSGKSYFMVNFFKNYLMTNSKIRVIDVGRSYKEFCETIGGQYIEFTEDSNICLNFFTNIQLDKDGNIHKDELQTIVPLIGLMAMQPVETSSAEGLEIPVIKSYISEAVVEAFKIRQRNAGMQDVVEALERKLVSKRNEFGETDRTLADLITALRPFGHPEGEYYAYFNGDYNLQFSSDFVVLELEEIDSKKHLKSVVLAAVSHTINTEFFLSGDRKQKKILFIDEAWSIMDDSIVMQFLETAARRIRKYYGALGIATQKLGDFNKNEATKAILANSAWKILLQQNQESLDAAKGMGMFGGENSILITMLETIKSQVPYYTEALFIQDSGAFFIGRLITDRVTHWISTGHHDDIAEIEAVMEEFGVDSTTARLIMGRAHEYNTSYEEEYSKMIQEGKIYA